MTSKLTHPLLAIPVSSGLLMALIAIWAVFQSDRWVINQAFLLFLPLLPLLATLYLTIYSRRTEMKSHWIRLALVWVGSNALGLFVITTLFLAFHTLAPAETSPTYNYDHFGFSSYVQGHDRSVVPGGKALDALLYDMEGNSVQLSSLWKQRPIVVEFGSITCPVFVGKVTTMNSLAQKYAGEIDFYVLYIREVHPGQNYPAHTSLTEKLQCAADLQREEGVGRTILIDDLDGNMHVAYGSMPNSVYLIGQDGVIAHRADWVNPSYLDQQIESLLATGGVGARVPPTSLTDNYTMVDQNVLATSLRVFSRAGLASGADFFVSFPTMVHARGNASPQIE